MIVVFWGVDAVICFAFVVYKQRHSDPRFFALDTLCIVRGGGGDLFYASAKQLFGGRNKQFFCGWETRGRQKELRVRIKKWRGGQIIGWGGLFFGKSE